MIWISLVSLLFFLLCTFLVIRLVHFDKVLISAFALKILAGITLGLIYKYHYQGGDTFVYFDQAAIIADYIVEHPEKIYSIFLSSDTIPELDARMVFADQPRALLFSRILSLFYLATGGNYWIVSCWLSLINFLGLYFLVFELSRKYPTATNVIIAGFFFLPTFVFWTSGLLKESLSIGALGVAVGASLRIVRVNGTSKTHYWLLIFAAIWLLWKLKYFYAAVLIPLLAVLLLLELTRGQSRYRFIIGISALVLLALLVSNLHYNLHFSRILNIVYENYLIGKSCADCGSISYYQFDGSLLSFAINVPLALVSGLFRPHLFEVSGLLPMLVAVENFVIFILTIVALWRPQIRLKSIDPWIIGAAIFIIILATLIAFSTPNFGTLSRYKVAYWPFFVLLVLSTRFVPRTKLEK